MIGTTRRGGVIARFLDERCEIGPGYRCANGPLYAAYVAWCDDAEEFQESQKALGLFLAERGFDRVRTGRSRGYVGLRLLGAAGMNSQCAPVQEDRKVR